MRNIAHIRAVVSDFVGREAGRSVALRTLRGPELDVSVDAEVPRPAASTLKVPIVIEVLRRISKGIIGGCDRVRREELGKTVFPTLLNVFRWDHEFTVQELCGITLATSDNLTAQYLLETVGPSAVNDLLSSLGCHASRLQVGFRDFELSPIGRANITTAADQVRLLSYLHGSPEDEQVLLAMENGLRKSRTALRFPEDLRIANKTGSLNGVANDVALIRDGGLHLAVSVLTDGQKDTATTAIEIGDMVFTIWRELGGRVDEFG
ncbi:serine hydrolase [Microbispora bryophytorum]|uniref:serine hydrolase n=1 Tax=Microbispora bryophytorum TaxID=1460882 RepID=UPI0036A619D9